MELDGNGHGIRLTGAGLQLFVASSDSALLSACQEVLRDLEATDSTGVNRAPIQICLWDYEPNKQSAAFPTPQAGQRVLYLVSAAHVDRLRVSLPEAEGDILLKPVSRAVLWAFLASATLNGAREREAAWRNEIGNLRADRDAVLQHLLHANLRLQEYDQQRTNFIARAVHDFRAPLTALSGFCGLLTSGELGTLSAVQQEIVGRMQRSTDRLSRMAAAMFELSVGPRLGRTPDLCEADILRTIRQAIHEIAPVAREKEIEIRTQLLPPAAPLCFEPSQMEQVLLNLLDNACKFVPKFGTIEVQSYPFIRDRREKTGTIGLETQDRRTGAIHVPNSYRIDIKDNGPRVAPELLEHIFEEYTSYSGPQDRSGGGLGLAICRLIINRHQGRLWVETSVEGSIFSIALPFREPGTTQESEEGDQ